MPLYDYICKCGSVEIDHFAPIDQRVRQCLACGATQHPALRAPADHTFKETFFEHLGKDGTLISSKRQLKEVSEKNNVYSQLLDG